MFCIEVLAIGLPYWCLAVGELVWRPSWHGNNDSEAGYPYKTRGLVRADSPLVDGLHRCIAGRALRRIPVLE